jgi:DNA (cytosine-5)-methyltransferase 1
MNETVPSGRITLGSLFDGIGAVPLAASYFGITPVWASEILPDAVSVTRRHFPDMAHLGDITKLDGGAMAPTDVIAFGSPCQSFSVAAGANRTGFDGKSGLFTEAVRIIREMRCATDGRYPKIALFENVCGLLGSGKGSYAGRDYQTVLSAFCESEIPMPRSGKWANAGMVRGNGFNLAWIVKDSAKHYRVAQRRRRLFVVVDFTGPGNGAGEILFVPQSLSGYFAARASEGQGTPADAESRSGSAGFNGFRSITGSLEYAAECAPCLNTTMPSNVVSDYGGIGQNRRRGGVAMRPKGENRPDRPSDAVVGAFMAGQHESARSIAYNEAVSPTLKGSPSGLNQVPCVVEPQIARTLTARGDGSPNVDGGPNIVAFVQNQRAEVRDPNDLAGGPAAEPGVKQQTHIVRPEPNCLTPWDTQQARIHTAGGLAPTLAGADGGGGRNPAGLVMTEPHAAGVHRNRAGEVSVSETADASGNNKPHTVHPDVAGTLCASGAGLNRPGGQGNETDLCVTYPSFCLQSNMIGRKDRNGPQGGGVNTEQSFTLGATDKHAVACLSADAAAADCRNFYENIEISGTLQSENTGGCALDSQNSVRAGYVIRRLTPLECERLMSLPDYYTAVGHDGKRMSDSARYRMCGNSIVVNVLAYIMQNIAAYLRGGDSHV